MHVCTHVYMHVSIKKTKVMTTEEINNFNIDNEDIESIKDVTYLGSVINSDGDSSQEIKSRLRLRRATVEILGELSRSNEVSLETKAEIIHTLIFPTSMYNAKVGQ